MVNKAQSPVLGLPHQNPDSLPAPHSHQFAQGSPFFMSVSEQLLIGGDQVEVHPHGALRGLAGCADKDFLTDGQNEAMVAVFKARDHDVLIAAVWPGEC